MNCFQPKNDVRRHEVSPETAKPGDILPKLDLLILNGNILVNNKLQLQTNITYEEVTFRKKDEEKQQPRGQPFVLPINIQESKRNCSQYQKQIWEQQAKNQLFAQSDQLRRKEASISFQPEEQISKQDYSKNEISAFSMRQISNLKALLEARHEIKKDKSRMKTLQSISNNNFQSNSQSKLAQKIEQIQKRTILLNRLMNEPIRKEEKAIDKKSPEHKSNQQCFARKPLNLREETLQLCRKALIKTRQIDLNFSDNCKQSNSFSSSGLKHQIDYSRRNKNKKSQQLQCLHEVQYRKLMKQIQNVEGINTLLISQANVSSQNSCSVEPKREKSQNSIELKPAINKKVKIINRKIKTTIEHHNVPEQRDLKGLEAINIKKYSTSDIQPDQEESSKQIFKPKEKKKRCNSTMLNLNEISNRKRYKVANIFKNFKEIQSRNLSEKDLNFCKEIQPISNSISVALQRQETLSPKKETIDLEKLKISEPNIKLSQQIANKTNIINSIKLFSDTRKSKNIAEILAQERHRFKTNFLSKDLQTYVRDYQPSKLH